MTKPAETIAELATAWAEQLPKAGQLNVPFDTDAELDLYRSAGRKAGRILHRPVQTLVNGDEVVIVLTDWVDNPLRAQVQANRFRKRLNQVMADSKNTTKANTQPQRPPAHLHLLTPPD